MERENINSKINGVWVEITAYWCCGCGYGQESVHDHCPITPFEDDYDEPMEEW